MSKMSANWHHQSLRVMSQAGMEANRLYGIKSQPFSRKTKPIKKQNNGNRDDAFSPPEQEGQDGDEDGKISFKHRVYVPKTPLVWDAEGRMLLFEVSPSMKRIPKLALPT